MKQVIIDKHNNAESFVNQIERKSKPVSQQQVNQPSSKDSVWLDSIYHKRFHL